MRGGTARLQTSLEESSGTTGYLLPIQEDCHLRPWLLLAPLPPLQTNHAKIPSSVLAREIPKKQAQGQKKRAAFKERWLESLQLLGVSGATLACKTSSEN